MGRALSVLFFISYKRDYNIFLHFNTHVKNPNVIVSKYSNDISVSNKWTEIHTNVYQPTLDSMKELTR